MTRRATTIDIIAVTLTLIASLIQATWAPIPWNSTDTAWTPASVSSVALFNDDTILDTTQVIFDSGDTSRVGRHANRNDWNQALTKCRATGEWTEQECQEAVSNGEF